jgi:Spy/CpxP family protein refolding chaperone
MGMNLKRRRSWILALLLALPMLPVVGFAAAPQGGYGGGMGPGGSRGGPSPDQQLKRMTKEFGLTADQQSKVKPILVDQLKKMDAVRDDTTVTRAVMRDKMMKIRQDSNGQIRALLNDKQKDKWDKVQQEREERMQNRGGESGGPGGADSGAPGASPQTPAPPQH